MPLPDAFARVPVVVVIGDHANAAFRLLGRLHYNGVVKLRVIPERSEAELKYQIRDADILISRPGRNGWVSAGVLIHAQPTLIIVSPSRGTDHIEFPPGQIFRIVYLNDEQSHALYLSRESVADLTIMLAHLLRRQLQQGISNVRLGRWNNVYADASADLDDLTWFVVGSGGQVRHLVRKLLNHHVSRYIICNPRLTPGKFESCLSLLDPTLCTITGDYCAVCRTPYAEMEILGVLDYDLIGSAGVVSLHTPAQTNNAPIVDSSFIQRLTPGTCVINTARGSLVDELLLVRAIATGRLRYAADVISALSEQTGDDAHSPLWKMMRSDTSCLLPLILTPHVGANTQRVLDEASLEVVLLALAELGISQEVIH